MRVICQYAYSPLIFVAPHGHTGDDYNTDLIAQLASYHAKTNLLINKGWRRNDYVDESKDYADCNNVSQVSQPVLEDEFLNPFKRMCLRAKRDFGECLVVFIHGVSDSVRKTTGVLDLDMILGYGLGKDPSITCSEVIKNKFIHGMQKDDINVCVGKSGGQYSGHSKNNMNQYWRKHDKNMHINSMQLEIVRELRQDKVICELMALSISSAISEAFYCTSFMMPYNFKYESV